MLLSAGFKVFFNRKLLIKSGFIPGGFIPFAIESCEKKGRGPTDTRNYFQLKNASLSLDITYWKH